MILKRFLKGSSFSGLPQPRPYLPIHGLTGLASSTDWMGTRALASAPSVLTVSDLKINNHAIQTLSAKMRIAELDGSALTVMIKCMTLYLKIAL